jgi:Na+/H+ antiporter NhaC
MRDKFRVNLMIALPAAILTFVLLLVFGKPDVIPEIREYQYNLIKVLPYVAVLALAIFGANVFLVLGLGTLLSGMIGIGFGTFGPLGFSKDIFNGFMGMADITILALQTGGLAALVKSAGGIDWMIHKIEKMISDGKTALIGSGVLVGLVDMAVANNTVAIIIAGPIVRKIARRYRLDPRKMAATLDIFSCIMQGLIPYGSQILIALSFARAIGFLDLISHLWYLWLLTICAVASFYIPYADGYLKKNPWNFSKNENLQ